MHRPPTLKNLVSSGGVLFRRSDEVSEVALVSIRGSGVWSLPKGIIEKDEDHETTAAREVMEETGIKGEILESIGHISYWYSLKEKTVKVHKTVHYFLMRYISGTTEDHDDEVDEAGWFPLEIAVNTLKYRGEKEIMSKAIKMIDETDKEA